MDYNAINVVEKPWGREIHFAVEDRYAGKILEVKKGCRLSLQYHKRKKETMYVIKGVVRVTLGHETEVVGEGKSITINPGMKHRVEALEDSKIVEVSTEHLDDVVRLEDDHGRIDRHHPIHMGVHTHISGLYAKFISSLIKRRRKTRL